MNLWCWISARTTGYWPAVRCWSTVRANWWPKFAFSPPNLNAVLPMSWATGNKARSWKGTLFWWASDSNDHAWFFHPSFPRLAAPVVGWPGCSPGRLRHGTGERLGAALEPTARLGDRTSAGDVRRPLTVLAGGLLVAGFPRGRAPSQALRRPVWIDPVPPVLLGELDAARFANHSHADLAGILQGFFDLAGDIAGEDEGLAIINLVGLNHHPQLASGLDGETFVDTAKGHTDLLEVLQPVDIGGHGFRAGSGTRGADGVGGADEDSQDGGVGHLIVV